MCVRARVISSPSTCSLLQLAIRWQSRLTGERLGSAVADQTVLRSLKRATSAQAIHKCVSDVTSRVFTLLSHKRLVGGGGVVCALMKRIGIGGKLEDLVCFHWTAR